MMDIKRLEMLDLSERASFLDIQESVNEIVEDLLRRDAFEFLKVLESRLRYLSPQELGPLVQEYGSLVTRLKFVALADLAEPDVIRLIREKVVDIFSSPPLDLKEQLRMRLVEMSIFERDDFKKKVRDALVNNKQLLTSNTLEVGGDRRPESPTVENWIRDYTYYVGSGIVPPIQRIQYVSRNPNFNRLSENEKKRVRTILDLLERYKYPSDVIHGLDDIISVVSNGRYYIVGEGQITQLGTLEQMLNKIKAGARPLRPGQATQKPSFTNAAKMIEALNRQQEPDDEIRFEAQEALLAKAGTNVGKVTEYLKHALVIRDDQALVTAIEALARSGAVAELLQSKAVRDAFSEEFLGPLAEEHKVPIETVRKFLDEHRDDRGFVSALIQWILRRAYRTNEPESARIGNQVENMLAALGNSRLVGMTYFDVTLPGYRWTPLRVKADGTLEWVE